MPISRSGGFEDSTYEATLTEVANQTGDREFASFVVPGGTWRNGEVVVVRVVALKKNDTGSDRNVILKTSVTGTGFTTVVASSTWTQQASEQILFGHMAFFRGGSSLYVPVTNATFAGSSPQVVSGGPTDMVADGSIFSAGSAILALTPTSFDSNITIALAINLPVANPSLYYKPRHVAAYKTVSWPIFG